MTLHMHKEGMKRFIAHIMRLSGVYRVGSQAGPKMAWESREDWLMVFVKGWG